MECRVPTFSDDVIEALHIVQRKIYFGCVSRYETEMKV